MRAVYEREKRLREAATRVVLYGEPPPSTVPPGTYVESATAAALRRTFEDEEEPQRVAPHQPREVVIYVDGASSKNGDGPGGWAAILVFGDVEREFSGYDPKTTNQRMELTAVLMGLRQLTRACTVHVVSDSAYVVNCFRDRWYEKWEQNGWVNAKRRPVENQDLWRELLEEVAKHEVTFEHVRGHAGHEYNERCDVLAVAAKKNGFGVS